MTKLAPIENLFYNLQCIFTFGGAWIAKVIIKKAIIEANQ